MDKIQIIVDDVVLGNNAHYSIEGNRVILDLKEIIAYLSNSNLDSSSSKEFKSDQ